MDTRIFRIPVRRLRRALGGTTERESVVSSRDLGLIAVIVVLAMPTGLVPSVASADEPLSASTVVLRDPEHGPPVTPFVYDGDVRALPRPRRWQPGDPTREIPMRFYDPPEGSPAIPDKLGLDPLLALQRLESSRAASTDVTRAASALTTGTFTTPTRSFDGIEFTGAWPPDPVGDVGPDHFIEMTNISNDLAAGSLVRIWDKAEPVPNELATFAPETLATTVYCSQYPGGDPIVLYDRQADRWLLTEFAAGNCLCVYLSRTGDPVSGGWYIYEFQAPVFPDYPKYAVWATDANGGAGSYVVGTNDHQRIKNVQYGPAVYALDRGAMLAGEPASFVRFNLPRLTGFKIQSVLPADPDGPLGPPSGEPAILMRHRDTEMHDGPDAPGDLLEMWLLDVDWEEPLDTTLTSMPGIDVAEFDSSICGNEFAGCFPQPDTETTLFPLREPLMHRLQYYNHGDRESLVGNYVVDVDGTDHGGIRWFEVRRSPGGEWGLHQEGTHSLDEHHRWMGSVAMDQDGNMALGYSTVSSTVYPELRYTGRMADDAPGWMTQPETVVRAGTGSSSIDRWGDYQAMGLDPEDDCTFWFTGMDETGAIWQTRIVSFRFETCGCVDPPPPPLEAEVNSDNRIDLFWDDSVEESVVEYLVQRSRSSGGPYELLSVVPDDSPGIGGGPGYSFQDTDVHGGITYYYVVLARDGTGCTSEPLNEVGATATGTCTLGPDFAGLQSAVSGLSGICSVTLAWGAAEAQCGGPVAYNVYRSETAGFTPGPESLLIGGLLETGLTDSDSLVAWTTYRYVVRAVDLANGAEDPNLVERAVTVAGPGVVPDTVFFEDFEAENSLEAWTIVNGPTHDCGDWRRTDRRIWQPTDSSGFYALSNSNDCSLSEFEVDTSLDSPELDLAVSGTLSVAVELSLRREGTESGQATIEAWDGAAWQVVATLPETIAQTGLTLDVTPWAAGNQAFRLRLRHRTERKRCWWAVDDVAVIVEAAGYCATAP